MTDALEASDCLVEVAHLLELTEQVLAAMRRGDWERAADLDGIRRPLVRRFFEPRPPPEVLAHTAETLRRVLALNEQLVGLAEHERRQLGLEAVKLRRSQAAAESYASHERVGSDELRTVR